MKKGNQGKGNRSGIPQSERPAVVLEVINWLLAGGKTVVTQADVFNHLSVLGCENGNQWLLTGDGERAYAALNTIFKGLVDSGKIVRKNRGQYVLAETR